MTGTGTLKRPRPSGPWGLDRPMHAAAATFYSAAGMASVNACAKDGLRAATPVSAETRIPATSTGFPRELPRESLSSTSSARPFASAM